MVESNLAIHPGKIRITTPGNEIWVDEVLHMPVGMMFYITDEETGEPVLCTMTYGGVCIEEFGSKTTPEILHNMIMEQDRRATETMEALTAAQAANEAAALLKQTTTDRDRDVN